MVAQYLNSETMPVMQTLEYREIDFYLFCDSFAVRTYATLLGTTRQVIMYIHRAEEVVSD